MDLNDQRQYLPYQTNFNTTFLMELDWPEIGR